MMENLPDSDFRNAALRRFWGRAFYAIAIIVFGWCAYAARAMFNFDLIHFHQMTPQELHDDSPVGMLIVALVLTGASLLWMLPSYLGARALATRGVVTEGTVVSVSVLRKAGKSPITFSYTVDGTTFTKRMDLSRDIQVGAAVSVLYDPKKPSRAEFLDVVTRPGEFRPPDLT